MASPGGGPEEESLPSAAPAPRPAPPLPPLAPRPDGGLSPDREGGGAGGGILRRRGPGKLPRRQVRFRLDAGSPEEEGGRREAPEPSEESPEAGGGRLSGEPSRGRAEDGGLGLATPALHSTMALAAEVQAAREQAFDARRAARDLLQRSFPTRCTVEARVGEGVSIPREQRLYRSLVSLQVPEEEVLSSAVEEKLALAGPRPEARKEPASEGPDPRAFYDPEELFTESPFLEVVGLLPPLERKPHTRDPAATFWMYRKLRQWDS
ncbi:protein phosphatase 1 regulatory subunit 35 [Paroedura picta]|uniref:protein phosphatase 1 regulatory subunit 35 n=1 Tax=Paroedura picta TaxID=143630 RepID=UPI00101416B7